MKRFSSIIFLVFLALGAGAQNRKHIANYSLFQQYFNPALTAYEGSVLKTFGRDQWTGYEDAPRTLFISAETNLADLKSWRKKQDIQSDNAEAASGLSQHAFGISYLQDTFGPFKESQLYLNYSTQVRLTETLSLRSGASLTYGAQRLDGSKLILEQGNDPELLRLLENGNAINKVDVNVGVMLTAPDYYVGYALQDAAKGKVSNGDDYLKSLYVRQHVAQAGYRRSVSEHFGVVANTIFRYDSRLHETLEGQVKGVLNNMFWAGLGYRNQLALTFNAGVRVNQFMIGYVHERPTGNANMISTGTNELALTYNFIPKNFPKFGKISIW